MRIDLLTHKGVMIEDDFIGFGTDIRSLNKKYKIETYGNRHSLVQVERERVIEMLNEILHETGRSAEDGYSYLWFGSDVSCWQEIRLEDAKEVERESKEDGTYEEMKKDIERDLLRSRYFDTIGIGKIGYYSEFQDECDDLFDEA